MLSKSNSIISKSYIKKKKKQYQTLHLTPNEQNIFFAIEKL